MALRSTCLLAFTLVACEPSSGTTSEGASESTSEASGSSTGTTTTGTTTTEPTTSGSGETTVDLPGLHFKQDIWPILTANCSCHIILPQGMPPGAVNPPILGEDPAVAYTVLIDQPSTVAGLAYVVPGDSTTSYLFHKIAGTQLSVGGNGTIMPPPPQTAVSGADLAIIHEWIDTGALE